MKSNRLQGRIIRVSAITMVVALLIGLIFSIFNINDPIAKYAVGSLSGEESSLDSSNNPSVNSNPDASHLSEQGKQEQDRHDTGLEHSAQADVSGKELPESEPDYQKDSLPYFESGGDYQATDPEEIELLKQYPDVVDLNFAGDLYDYNPLEQWRYDKIMEKHDQLPENLQRLLEKRPQSVHFVYKYFDYLENPQNYDPDAKANKTSFESAKYLSKYPYYSNWDSTWGYSEYSLAQLVTSGCGPVNFAMLVAGMNQDETMTPTKALEFAKEHGYEDKTGKGSNWDLFTHGVEKFGIKSEVLDRNQPGPIIKALKDGKPVIMMVNHPRFTSVGHFILLYDIEGDLVKVQDSNSVSNSNQKWKLSELLQETQGVWTFHK